MGNRLFTLCPTDFYDDGAFDETYEVDEANAIGSGKFSTVHLCWKRNSPDTRYALKVLNTGIDDFSAISRIKEEIEIMQILGNHPGIITLIDVDESVPNTIRIVMDLCEGGELYDAIQEQKFFTEPDAKATIKNLLEAVAYIHSKGIMHRDLKPPGTMGGLIAGKLFGLTPMDGPAGEEANGAMKLATSVAYKVAAVYNENAQHSTAVAMELDNSRRLIERYVMGTDEDVHKEALAAPIEENPQRYTEFPYKMGWEKIPVTYPVPGSPSFPNQGIDFDGADRHEEDKPTGWTIKGTDKDKGSLTLLSEKLMDSTASAPMLLLRPPQLPRHRSCPAAPLTSRHGPLQLRHNRERGRGPLCASTNTAGAKLHETARRAGSDRDGSLGVKRSRGRRRGEEFL